MIQIVRHKENARKLALERHSLESASKIKVRWYEDLLSG